MADTLARLESFPFDSKLDGYDDYGYPVYDRAVGARMLRDAFAKFFSDGIFPQEDPALFVDKGSGLSVTVSPGVFIINGALGGILDEPEALTLSDSAPAGRIIYGIMVRYDANDEYRSLYLRVAAGDAGGAAPEPESAAAVKEYRIATVEVPSGATDLSEAVITNEAGTETCPYAAPFDEIDVSQVTADARSWAQSAYASLVEYIDTYKSLVASSLDNTAAGNLQAQINEIGRIPMTDDEIRTIWETTKPKK